MATARRRSTRVPVPQVSAPSTSHPPTATQDSSHARTTVSQNPGDANPTSQPPSGDRVPLPPNAFTFEELTRVIRESLVTALHLGESRAPAPSATSASPVVVPQGLNVRPDDRQNPCVSSVPVLEVESSVPNTAPTTHRSTNSDNPTLVTDTVTQSAIGPNPPPYGQYLPYMPYPYPYAYPPIPPTAYQPNPHSMAAPVPPSTQSTAPPVPMDSFPVAQPQEERIPHHTDGFPIYYRPRVNLNAMAGELVKTPKFHLTFNGSGSWHTFLKQFEITAEGSNWTADQACMALINSLTGQAALAIDNLHPRYVRNQEYLGLRAVLSEVFASGRDPCLAEIDLYRRSQRPGESTHDFAMAINSLAKVSSPSDTALANRRAVTAFIQGLNNKLLATMLASSQFPNVYAAEQHLTRLMSVAAPSPLPLSIPSDLAAPARSASTVRSPAVTTNSVPTTPALPPTRFPNSGTTRTPETSEDFPAERLKAVEATLKVLRTRFDASDNNTPVTTTSASTQPTPSSTTAPPPFKPKFPCFHCGGDHFKRNCPHLSEHQVHQPWDNREQRPHGRESYRHPYKRHENSKRGRGNSKRSGN